MALLAQSLADKTPLIEIGIALYTAFTGGREITVIRLKVREAAQRQGISQTRLGQLAFIDVERMRKIWRGGTSESANLTLQVLDRIATALQVDASELIESVPNEP
jgi:DNA-binding Xre family transcriptional regulator